jgi:hypothetical protein
VLIVLIVLAVVIVLVAALSFGGWDNGPTVVRRTIIRRPARRIYEERPAERRVYEEPAPRVYEERRY